MPLLLTWLWLIPVWEAWLGLYPEDEDDGKGCED
jgi:hypothetical protein